MTGAGRGAQRGRPEFAGDDGPRGRTGRALALALALVAAPSLASAAANCWTIEDSDQRAYCRAVASNSAGQCTAISDFSLRQTCRARLQTNPVPCNSLTSEWERQECRKLAGR